MTDFQLDPNNPEHVKVVWPQHRGVGLRDDLKATDKLIGKEPPNINKLVDDEPISADLGPKSAGGKTEWNTLHEYKEWMNGHDQRTAKKIMEGASPDAWKSYYKLLLSIS